MALHFIKKATSPMVIVEQGEETRATIMNLFALAGASACDIKRAFRQAIDRMISEGYDIASLNDDGQLEIYGEELYKDEYANKYIEYVIEELTNMLQSFIFYEDDDE